MAEMTLKMKEFDSLTMDEMMAVDGGKYVSWALSAAGVVACGLAATPPVAIGIAAAGFAYSHYQVVKNCRPTNRHHR